MRTFHQPTVRKPHGQSYWETEDEAPDGWERLCEGGVYDVIQGEKYETWADAEGNLLYVPVKYRECDYCDGEGWNSDDDEEIDGEDCQECDGEGYDFDCATFNFDFAISKPVIKRIETLTRRYGPIMTAGLQWWEGAP